MTTTTACADRATTLIRYRWDVLTDLHLAGPDVRATHWHNMVMRNESRSLLRTALAQIAEHNIERLLLLGDLADEATTADYDYLLHALDERGLPVWLIPGNHDRPPDGHAQFDDALAGRPDSELPPAGAHMDRCVVITGALHANPAKEEDYTLLLEVPPGRDDTLLVVLTHFPLLDLSATLRDAGLENAGELNNRAETADTVAQWPGPVLILHGHQHIRTHAIVGNVLQLGFAALAEQPHDLATLELDLEDLGPDSGLVIDIRRHCSALSTPPHDWRRSLLDADQTRFTWTTDRWQSIPEMRDK